MKTKIFITLYAVSFFTVQLFAQSQRTAYFMEGMIHRYQLNPAFAPERSFFSLPVLGSTNVMLNGNLGVSDILYQSSHPDYDLTTFLSPDVDGIEFLNKLKNNNKINAEIDLSLLSFGFKAWGGFTTVDVGLHVRTKSNLPKDLFSFLKEQNGNKTYVLDNFSANASAYSSIALGHSRNLNEVLRVGVRAKYLIGLGHFDARFDQMQITMNENEWLIKANGKMDISAGDVSFGKDENDIIDDIKIDRYQLSGMGGALDLGLNYDFKEFVPNLSFSAALTDLGFIRWTNNKSAINERNVYTFNGFDEIGMSSNSDNSDLEGHFDDLSDQVQELFNFREDESGKTKNTTSLAAKLAIGAEYKVPVYEKLSFGFLFTHSFQKHHSWSEGRFSANLTPVSWFDAAVSAAFSTYGTSMGWLVNFHPKGFNLFLGSDFMIFKVTPQFIPLHNTNAHISLGISFPFGNKI